MPILCLLLAILLIRSSKFLQTRAVSAAEWALRIVARSFPDCVIVGSVHAGSEGLPFGDFRDNLFFRPLEALTMTLRSPHCGAKH